MNKSIRFEYNKNIITNLKCPHCNIGHLVIKKDLLNTEQYKHNEKYMEDKYDGQYFYIHDFLGVIGGLLQCSHCNDYVSFAGEIIGDEDYEIDNDGEHHSINISYLNFKYINPPIYIIPIHDEYPKIIKEILNESFSFYFNHPASCVNKLRVLVEEVLNNLKIKKNARKNSGGLRRLSAHERIKILETKNKYKEASEYLLALKWIGNEGSHKNSDFTIEELLETYKILEKALDLIYVKSDTKLKKIITQINKQKGR